MKSKIRLSSYIIIAAAFLTFLNCSNVAIRQPYSVISGVVTPESYNSKSTFIDKNTVSSLFEHNNLEVAYGKPSHLSSLQEPPNDFDTKLKGQVFLEYNWNRFS